jgi:hypothetical protein
MSTAEGQPGAGQPSEEELRAAYEAEIKKIRVEHVLLEQIVTLVNLGMRRTGLAPGTESERDPAQVRLAIEGIRVLMPLIEQAAPQQAGPIRDALSQLQLAFVRIGGKAPESGERTTTTQTGGGPGESGPGPAGGGPGEETPGQGRAGQPSGPAQPKPGEAGPAQRSGRLWVPGQ